MLLQELGRRWQNNLSEKGATLILSARNATALNLVKKELKNSVKVIFVCNWIWNILKISPDLAKQVFDKYGRIDFLFNNGGLSQRSTVAETSLEIDRRIMEINYFGNIALTKAVLPYMIQQKSGHIIVISSIAGKFGFFLRSAYSASKHALYGFYESLLLEEEKNGIRITIASPGKINTEISKHALNAEGTSHGLMDHNQSTGMSAEECVKQLLSAVTKNKKDILIGNKEILAVKIKRFFPALFWRIIKKQSAT